MYSDYEDKRSYPIRNLLIGLILVVVFVLLLVWLLPTSKVDLDGFKHVNGKLDILTDRIFAANVDSMKGAAINYYSVDRLPKEKGDKVKLSLKEMLDKKLLLEMNDKNGKACDVNASYVEVEKTGKESYEMKVNLKCSDREDYIKVHLGCYNYCEGFVCEKTLGQRYDKKTGKTVIIKDSYKKPTTPGRTVIGGPSCELAIQEGVYGKNGWLTGDAKVGFKYKSSSTDGARIVAYDVTGSSNPTYNGAASLNVSQNGYTVVYGHVKDSNNQTAVCTLKVKKDNVKPSCEVNLTSGTRNADGLFVGNVKTSLNALNDAESGIERFGMDYKQNYNFNNKRDLITNKAGRHTVYGFVEDKAGNKAVCHANFRIIETEKPVLSNPSCELAATGDKGLNNWYRSNVNVEFVNKASTNGARIVEYGLSTSGLALNGLNNLNITNDGYYTVKGYVKDSNGYTSICSVNVKRDATKPSCSLGVISGNYNNGYYIGNVTVGFKNKSDNLSGIREFGLNNTANVDYNGRNEYIITKNGENITYGMVKDNAGNVNVCALKTVTKAISFEYQYAKYFSATYSNWSDWLVKEYSKVSPPSWKNTDTYQVEDLGGVKTTKYITKIGEPIMQTQIEPYKTVTIKACDGFDYYIMGNRTQTEYTQVVQKDIYVKKTRSCYRRYVNTITVETPPTNNLRFEYEFAGLDWNHCHSNCTRPNTKWKRYDSCLGTTTKAASSSSARTVVVDSVTYDGVTVRCSNPVEKAVKIYAQYQKQVGFTEVREPVTTTVYKYRYRVRNIVKEGYTDYRWSPSINDTYLISQGYKYTGNRRIVG